MSFGPKRPVTETFRDAPIIFKNFTGEKRNFNAEGVRNFSVMMNEADALTLLEAGWNIKPLKRREDDEEQLYHLKVAVSYANLPPRVWLISSGGRTLLGESMVGMLDQLQPARIDLIVSAYDYEINGNKGRKAYLQSLFFTMYEDELELEYAHVPQFNTVGENPQLEIEAGSRKAYEYDGEVVE